MPSVTVAIFGEVVVADYSVEADILTVWAASEVRSLEVDDGDHEAIARSLIRDILRDRQMESVNEHVEGADISRKYPF